jgi:hypothetical protein
MKKIIVVLLMALAMYAGQVPGAFAAAAEDFTSKNISDRITILSSKAEHREKWQAKEALVKIGAQAVEPLIESLKNGEARYYAIRALGEIRDARAVEPLGEIAVDRNYGPRRYALAALAAIGSRKALPFFKQALSDEYFGGTAAYLAQFIDPSKENNYFQKELFRQTPNGLKVSLSANRIVNTVAVKVTFSNISSQDFVIQIDEIYKGLRLFAQAQNGLIINSSMTAEYKYMTGKESFHSLEPGGTFSFSIVGEIVRSKSPPDRAEEMAFMYPSGTYKTINFDDSRLDVGILKGDSCSLYYIFESGSVQKKWAQEKFGFTDLWSGKAVSNPVKIRCD